MDFQCKMGIIRKLLLFVIYLVVVVSCWHLTLLSFSFEAGGFSSGCWHGRGSSNPPFASS